MSAVAWAWRYGRDEALRGASTTRARCGPRVCVAMLETEAEQRLKRRCAASDDGATTTAGRLEAALDATLDQIGGEMRQIASRLLHASPLELTVRAEQPYEKGGVGRGEWCDLRALAGGGDVPRTDGGRSEGAIDGETAAKLKAQFELWRLLGTPLTSFDNGDGHDDLRLRVPQLLLSLPLALGLGTSQENWLSWGERWGRREEKGGGKPAATSHG